MPKIKRILLDKDLNPIEGYNFNAEFEFSSITEAFEAFRQLESEHANRIDIYCNTCFLVSFDSLLCWYFKFVIENSPFNFDSIIDF